MVSAGSLSISYLLSITMIPNELCYTRGREIHENIKKLGFPLFSFCKDLFLMLQGRFYDSVSIHVLDLIVHWNKLFQECFLLDHECSFGSLGKILIAKCGHVFRRAAALLWAGCW